MKINDYNELKEWFINYTDSFLSEPNADKENILLKKQHTLRVCDNMTLIATELSDNEQLIALTSALLHDIGRFEQLKQYGTFSDFKSEDHASLGVRVLKELGTLHFLTPGEAELIITAIENHNKATIETGLTAQALQICKLLRDADKLDIWRVVISYYKEQLEKENPTLVHNLPSGDDVTQCIYETLKQQKIVPFKMLRSVIDIKIVQMGWIYDINTDKALAVCAERGYLTSIYQTLPATQRINELYQIMQKHLSDNVSLSLN
ncbi:HD domain-containing protein [Psychromonas sp. PT13]|uniref:HD domain-containing protein n=1 Tax=Psychromonas sp. PT13 TaxID=3439547 RepID=UPI003EC0C672